jgi:hypothetical protein
MIQQGNGIWKQERIAIFICDNINYKPKLARGNKEGQHIWIKGTIEKL